VASGKSVMDVENAMQLERNDPAAGFRKALRHLQQGRRRIGRQRQAEYFS
jgi:hypothetical protein